MKYSLRMTAAQHAELRAHLFPGDQKEAVALLLCGRRNGLERHIFTVRQVLPVPHDACDRYPDRITWRTEFADPLMKDAYGKGQAVLKVHGHGLDYRNFSPTDDVSDQSLFAAVTSFLDDGFPHASLIMVADGEMFGRVLGDEGRLLAPLSSVMVTGTTCGSGPNGHYLATRLRCATLRRLELAPQRSFATSRLPSSVALAREVSSPNNSPV
jgi:hypothetical protein